MDFVVVGFGIGSICILVGLVLRDAPGWRAHLPGRRPETPDGARTARLCRALGNVLLACGIVLSAVTLVALFAGFSDGVGAFVVATAVTVLAIGIVAWAARWRQRNPPPRRPRAEPALAAAPLPLAVAIARGVAQERAAFGDEIDEAVEASGLTVERTVLAQERGEAPEPMAEGRSSAHEMDERPDEVREHHPSAARGPEPVAADLVSGGDWQEPSAAPAGFDHDVAMLNGDRPAANEAVTPDDAADAPQPSAHASGTGDKPRDA